MAKDIFKEQLHPVEGFQQFSEKSAKESLNFVNKDQRKRFCVRRDERPFWRKGDKSWKQTWSIQRRDKMKQLGIKCSS